VPGFEFLTTSCCLALVKLFELVQGGRFATGPLPRRGAGGNSSTGRPVRDAVSDFHGVSPQGACGGSIDDVTADGYCLQHHGRRFEIDATWRPRLSCLRQRRSQFDAALRRDDRDRLLVLRSSRDRCADIRLGKTVDTESGSVPLSVQFSVCDTWWAPAIGKYELR